jgi:hypothetical protein
MGIEKDDGSWVAEPSGLKAGDLKSWRDGMFKICPEPKVGDIVVITHEKTGKKVGYKALTSEGYHTRWLRVSTNDLEKFIDSVKNSIDDKNSVFYGHTGILFDQKIMNGMRSLANEGFDEEILADYAHQMSK